jgi:hypothetical protein
MLENTVEPHRPKRTTWRMRIACWAPKAKNTHSQYVILIAFPLQQWLDERASVLRYTYIGCFVVCKVYHENITMSEERKTKNLFGVTLIGMCGGFSWSSVKNSISYASPHSAWPLIGSHSAEHSWERIIVYDLRICLN